MIHLVRRRDFLSHFSRVPSRPASFKYKRMNHPNMRNRVTTVNSHPHKESRRDVESDGEFSGERNQFATKGKLQFHSREFIASIRST